MKTKIKRCLYSVSVEVSKSLVETYVIEVLAQVFCPAMSRVVQKTGSYTSYNTNRLTDSDPESLR